MDIEKKKRKIPVQRLSNKARIDRSKNETQIRDQSPGRECPHATFSTGEEVIDTAARRHGRDRSDDATDKAVDEDARDVRSGGDGEAEDAVEERRAEIERPASEPVRARRQQQRTHSLTEQLPEKKKRKIKR